jgi:type I restriction enzyme S subunit
MIEWKEYKLGEIGSFNNGVNKNKSSFGHGFPFVNLMDIFDKDRIDYIPHGLVDVNQDELNRYSIKDGDILFVRSSVKLDGVGKVCAVTKDLANTIYSGFIIRFRQPNLILDKIFSSYYLNSSPIRTQVISKGTLSANSNVNQESLKTIQIRIPSIPEQRQIAHILITNDAVIEETQAAIAKYKAIKQGMLHDLFTRDIDIITGKLRPKCEDAPELYKESKLGMVPKEWEVDMLGNVCDVTSSKRIYANEYDDFGIPFYRSLEIILKSKNQEIETTLYISNEKYDAIEKQFGVPQYGDILITSVGTLGISYRVSKQDLFYFKDGNLIWFRNFSDKEYSKFLQFTLDELIRKQFDKITIGTSQKAFTIDKLKKLDIYVPEEKEYKVICERVENINQKLHAEQNYLHKLQHLKAGLMGDLLSGRKKVTVPEEVLTQTEN